MYTNQDYFAITPFSLGARVFAVGTSGGLAYSGVHSSRGIRPVINLRSDVKLIGNGTYNNPYRLAE